MNTDNKIIMNNCDPQKTEDKRFTHITFKRNHALLGFENLTSLASNSICFIQYIIYACNKTKIPFKQTSSSNFTNDQNNTTQKRFSTSLIAK